MRGHSSLAAYCSTSRGSKVACSTLARRSLADLKACLERQGVPEQTIRPGDAVFVRTGHGSRWYTETRTFYDGAPGIGLECARWFSSLQVCVVGADNFAVEVVPPVDPEIFHPCRQHLIMENGIHLHEGMTFEGLAEREAWVFAYVFAPLPIVGATGSPGKPDRGAVSGAP
jgi:kynurenine formamidase